MTLATAIAANIVLIAGLLALLAYVMTRPARLRPHAEGAAAPRRHRTVQRERHAHELPRTARVPASARA